MYSQSAGNEKLVHETIKVSLIIDDNVENFYIKLPPVTDLTNNLFGMLQQSHLIKLKTLVFARNPNVNTPNLKIYWIDAENDKILISCEEDLRLYFEQGRGKKIFFNASSSCPKSQQEHDEEVAMEAEESCSYNKSKLDRRARKLAREEERKEERERRVAKRLTEKMKHAEEKLQQAEERRGRHPEKSERKNTERLERAKKRCEQFRKLIAASMDPANLNAATNAMANFGESISGTAPSATNTENVDPMAMMHPSAETIRILSTAIAGCLQPCNLINKILNEIIGMVPQPAGTEESNEPSAQTSTGSSSSDQQQQTEVPKQNSATNTSDVNTPATGHPSNAEIEALFKEAAKELEKMNEIVQSGKMNESLVSLASSSTTGITQVEKTFENVTDSAISDATVINASAPVEEMEKVDEKVGNEDVWDGMKSPSNQPTRSRESSIEIHDINSMMSEDSRDWTLLDATGDEVMVSDDGADVAPMSVEPIKEASVELFPKETEAKKEVEPLPSTSTSTEKPSTGAIPKQIETPKDDSIKSVSTETQTQSSLLIDAEKSETSSLHKSIQTVEEINEIVKETITSAQKTIDSMTTISNQSGKPPKHPKNVASGKNVPSTKEGNVEKNSRGSAILNMEANTPANLRATRDSSIAAKSVAGPNQKHFGPALVVYDPNPKINASIHQMMNMGFSNEDGWLTQLLIHVDGDVAKAVNFLTPRPKNKPEH